MIFNYNQGPSGSFELEFVNFSYIYKIDYFTISLPCLENGYSGWAWRAGFKLWWRRKVVMKSEESFAGIDFEDGSNGGPDLI